MNNLILEKVDNLILFIKDSKEYNDYMFLKEKLLKNTKVNNYIDQIKSLQKEIIRNEVIGEDTKNLNNEIESLLVLLEKIPLYNDFIDKQKELDEVYQYIKITLDDYFSNLLN